MAKRKTQAPLCKYEVIVAIGPYIEADGRCSGYASMEHYYRDTVEAARAKRDDVLAKKPKAHVTIRNAKTLLWVD